MADYRVFQIKLNRRTDVERIAWLESQENYTDTIRTLIDQTMKDDTACDGPTEIDLGAIRTVFEAVLEERLSGLALASAGRSSQDEDPLAGAKLDAMF